jgi:hypothetical protein
MENPPFASLATVFFTDSSSVDRLFICTLRLLLWDARPDDFKQTASYFFGKDQYCNTDGSVGACHFRLLFVANLYSDRNYYRIAGKSLARTGSKQATATEDFDIHIFYLLS